MMTMKDFPPGFHVEEMKLLVVLRAIGRGEPPVVIRDQAFVHILSRLGIEQRMVKEAGSRHAIFWLGVVASVAGSVPNTPTLTGNSGTWTAQLSKANDNTRVTIFTAPDATTAGALTADYAGQIQDDILIEIDEFGPASRAPRGMGYSAADIAEACRRLEAYFTE